MSDLTSRAIARFTKGAIPTLAGLQIVLHADSVPCPECDDDGSPCLYCLAIGWVILTGDTQ